MWIWFTFLSVYLLAVNLYAFLYVKRLNDEQTGEEKDKAFDGKLILAGLVGGAVTIYVSMFLLKYRTQNMFLMIFMPLLAVANVLLAVLAFRSGATFFVTGA